MPNLSRKKPFWIYSRRCDVHWNLPRNRTRSRHQIEKWYRAAFCKQQGDEFEQTTPNGQKYSKKRWLMTFLEKYLYRCKKSRISVIVKK